jgi:mono/diheme cytochrome c family protein
MVEARKELRFLLRTMKSVVCLFALLFGASVPLAAAERTADQNFRKHCVDCHGRDGKAQTRLGRKSGAKDLSDKAAQAKLTDADVIKTIKEGRKDAKGEEKMEAFGDELSDKEIAELAAYVRTLAQ